jgi:hypothetical protein
MRVFIRKRKDSKFLAEGDQWVPSRNKGLNFVSSIFALDAATRMKLNEIEIVLDFEGRGHDVVLNVPDDPKNPPRLR